MNVYIYVSLGIRPFVKCEQIKKNNEENLSFGS